MILFSRRTRASNALSIPVHIGEPASSHEASTDGNAFTVPVGRGETRAALNLRFVVPAVKREDLTLRIEGQMLRLSGERRPPVGFGEAGRCFFAMRYGTFSQGVLLPEGLDVRRMHAYLHEGVLDVHIPFAAAGALALGPERTTTAAADIRRGSVSSGAIGRSADACSAPGESVWEAHKPRQHFTPQ